MAPAKPERTIKNIGLACKVPSKLALPKVRAAPTKNTAITTARTAVAKVVSISFIPILPKIATPAADIAAIIAKIIQVIKELNVQ